MHFANQMAIRALWETPKPLKPSAFMRVLEVLVTENKDVRGEDSELCIRWEVVSEYQC